MIWSLAITGADNAGFITIIPVALACVLLHTPEVVIVKLEIPAVVGVPVIINLI